MLTVEIEIYNPGELDEQTARHGVTYEFSGGVFPKQYAKITGTREELDAFLSDCTGIEGEEIYDMLERAGDRG